MEPLLEKRLRPLAGPDPDTSGSYVLYWMQQFRRLHDNFALQHAVYRAKQHGVPLLIFEALRCDYPFASDRHHYFALQSMLEHRKALQKSSIGYFPWVEQHPGQGKGLLELLCQNAVEVVSDDVPAFIVPGHNRALSRIASKQGKRATAVDSNGVLPIRLLEKASPTAAVFRRHIHKHLSAALSLSPKAKPLARHGLPAFDEKWLAPSIKQFGHSQQWLDDFSRAPTETLAQLPVDHSVPAVLGRGGHAAGHKELLQWLATGLMRYGERSDPTAPAASGLSPYLHWGHMSSHEIVRAVWETEAPFAPEQLPEKGGSREGYWPLSLPLQSFYDEIITWRELGYHTCALRPDEYDQFDSLPPWALQTLREHAEDERPYIYSRELLEQAQTHDDIWNAAQRQLCSHGIIHNYLRMLWGKKILEWSASPEEAYETAISLNNKWSLDGRNPNSWSGVLWCFGRYDRPWQERDIFGKIRFMSSDSTRRKFKLAEYLAAFSAEQ